MQLRATRDLSRFTPCLTRLVATLNEKRMTMTTAKKPAFTVWTVTGEGKQAFWTRIGSAWPQNHGEGYNIDLRALPVNGRIVLMPPKDDDRGQETEERARPVGGAANGQCRGPRPSQVNARW